MGIFDWPITKKLKKKSPPLGCFYRLEEQNLGQRKWDKIRSYWELVGESIGNLRT
jgi:hypothetical protein